MQMPRITTNSTGLFMVIDGQATIAAGGSNLLVLGATAGAVMPAANLKFDGWTIKVEYSERRHQIQIRVLCLRDKYTQHLALYRLYHQQLETFRLPHWRHYGKLH
jgi:hypothetical protein